MWGRERHSASASESRWRVKAVSKTCQTPKPSPAAFAGEHSKLPPPAARPPSPPRPRPTRHHDTHTHLMNSWRRNLLGSGSRIQVWIIQNRPLITMKGTV